MIRVWFVRGLHPALMVYHLWKAAKFIDKDIDYNLDIEVVQDDLKKLLKQHNGKKFTIFDYYGKRLYVTVYSDLVESIDYDYFNDEGTMKKVLDYLQWHEIWNVLDKYHDKHY